MESCNIRGDNLSCNFMGADGGGDQRRGPPRRAAELLDLGPRLEEGLHDAFICQGAEVAELAVIPGNLAQDAPHYLPGPGLGKPGREVDILGRCEWTYLRPNCKTKKQRRESISRLFFHFENLG